MIDLNIVDKEFREFVKGFDMSVERIALKFEHTFEVVKVTEKICKLKNLNDEDTALAKTIAYFHDLGRFIQVQRIDSFDDSILDHAVLGVELLFDNNYIEKFNIDKKYYDIIYKAIINHNTLTIEEGLNERELFFSKLIRDADKIDILRVNIKYRKPEFIEKPSVRVMEDFNNNVIIKKGDCHNRTDKILLLLAFIYDINFKESYIVLNELNYYKDFIDMMKVSEDTKEILKEVKENVLNYFNRKLED